MLLGPPEGGSDVLASFFVSSCAAEFGSRDGKRGQLFFILERCCFAEFPIGQIER